MRYVYGWAKNFSFTLKRVPETLKEFLIKHKLTADDIDFFIFHRQVNS